MCQFHLPQQWSNLRLIGPIYEFIRHLVAPYSLTYLSSLLHAAQVFFYQIQFDVRAQTIQIKANHTSQAFIFNILKVNITLEGLDFVCTCSLHRLYQHKLPLNIASTCLPRSSFWTKGKYYS